MDYGDSFHASEDDSSVVSEENTERIIDEAPIDEGALDQFLHRGRHIHARTHPFLNRGLSWISSDANVQKSASEANNVFQAIESSIFQIPGDYDGRLQQWRSKLMLDLADICEDLQNTYDEDDEADVTIMVSAASAKYRERINETLHGFADLSETEGLSEADEAWQQLLFDSNSVRQCAEAIYFPPNSDSLLCDKLMDWVNVTDPRPSQQDGEDIMTTRKPYLHPGFWDYVSKGILRGLFEMVGICLQNSGLSNLDTATSTINNGLCLLLRTCPRVSNYASDSQSFRERHRVWRSKVLKASKDLDLSDPELSAAFRQVYELLKGDKDAVCRQSDTWQECLAALALLYDPSGLRAPKDVRAIFEMITESDDFGLSVDRTLPAEDACAALCEELVPKAITKARAVDLSLATHLADLLDKLEVLDDIRSGDLDLTIREVLSLALGDACIAEPEGWKAAITYWKACGDAGLDSIQQIIVRIFARSQSEVDEILDICNDLNLSDEASTIESSWARRLEGTGNLNDAINSFDRVNNAPQIDRLNWVLAEQSLLEGCVSTNDKDLMESLETPQNTRSKTISTLMAPFATLAAMYRLKSCKDSIAAALHLAALIKSSDVPKSYSGVLMAEMLPFLDLPPDQSFSTRDLFDSLAAIEEFYDSEDFESGLELLHKAKGNPMPQPSSGIPDWRTGVAHKLEASEILALVRLRIADNLATRFYLE